MFKVTRKPNGTTAHSAASERASGHFAKAPPPIRRLLRSARLSTTTASAGPVPAIVNRALSEPGHALPEGERAVMERGFGHSFANVRVHDNAIAATSAQAISANAFTIGRSIFFGRDQFQPGSTSSRRLLAHELAHVMQNDRDSSAATATAASTALAVSTTDDPREYAANLLADRALTAHAQGRHVAVQRQASAGMIQRSKSNARPADLLEDPDVSAAVDAVWQDSFGHTPFKSDTLDLENLPEAGEHEHSSEPEMPKIPPSPGSSIGSYRGGKYEGVTFREAFFFIQADGKPSPIQVSKYPLDIKDVVAPSDALAFVHSHPTQKRATASETGATLIVEGMAALTDEQAAQDLNIPVYAVGQNTVLKTYPDLRSEVFSRKALARRK